MVMLGDGQVRVREVEVDRAVVIEVVDQLLTVRILVRRWRGRGKERVCPPLPKRLVLTDQDAGWLLVEDVLGEGRLS